MNATVADKLESSRKFRVRRKTMITIAKTVFCIFLCAIILVPVYMVVINSFKSKSEAARMSLALPTSWHFENYITAFEQGKLMLGMTNSLIYAFVSSAVGVVGSAMAAFVMSRRRTKFNGFLYYFVLCGLFFPVNYVTLLKVFTTLNLNNTRFGIVLTFTSSMIPFCVFTIRNFVSSLPVELDEAAVLDGTGPLTLFFRVIFPLMKPTLVTCFILQFMGIWSDFLTPLYLSSKSSLFPMTMAVYQFFGRNSSYWNLVFADIVLTCLPVTIVYLLGQRYIVSGITSGAVKE